MKNAKMVICLGALAACAGAPRLSVAEDNCSGHDITVYGVIHVLIESDSSLPSHLAIGRCASTGKTSLECTYKDKDGDDWTVVIESRGDGSEGTFYKVRGTGKWENVKRSGWWKTGRNEGGVKIDPWGGNCTWPAESK
jgi:hypothetical protein